MSKLERMRSHGDAHQYQTRQDNKKCESESQEGANTDKTF